jgi:hypothetical protein
VCEHRETLRSFLSERPLASARVLAHRPGDRIVETPVQGVELRRGDRRLEVEGHLGHRLADVAVGVDDLIDREPEAQQLRAVSGGALADLVVRDEVVAEGRVELVQKQGDSPRELFLGGARCRPLSDFCAGAIENGRAVRAEEILQHRPRL